MPSGLGGINKMANLQNILYKVHLLGINGTTNIEVKDVQIDSRKVSAGSLFVAVKGSVADGHNFISTAIEKGALAVVCEELPLMLLENITYIRVSNCSEAVAYIAHNFYDEPSTKVEACRCNRNKR